MVRVIIEIVNEHISSKCSVIFYANKIHLMLLSIEKEEKLAKHFIPYTSGGDWGPYEFEGTYEGPYTHVVKTAHRQPGYGIRRALLKR